MGKKELLTQSQFARKCGVSRQRINDLVKSGVVNLVDGRIDPEAADRAIAANADPSKAKKLRPAKSDFQAARAVKEYYLAQLRKLEYEKESGQLVEKEQVKKDAFDTGRRVRDALLNIPDRVAATLSTENDEGRVYKILTEEIKKALWGINPYAKTK